MAHFAYNSAKSSVPGFSPFFANYGYEPTIKRYNKRFRRSEHQAEHIDPIYKQMVLNIKQSAESMRK
jgi:hypothetical protein